MKWRTKLPESWRSAVGGATLCSGLGLALLFWGNPLFYLSYDLLFLFRSTPPLEDVVIIYMDDRSFEKLGQVSVLNWDRSLHAQLLDRLTADQARLVIFDVVFSEPGSPSANAALAGAIRRNGRVVLAAALDTLTRPQAVAKSSVLPLDAFREGATLGITETWSPLDAVARQYFVGSETQPSLPWAAAVLAGAEITKAPGASPPDTWLNYYGKAITLPQLSYCDVSIQPEGIFATRSSSSVLGRKTSRRVNKPTSFGSPTHSGPASLRQGLK